MPAASIISTAAITGEPNRNETAANVPQAAISCWTSGGASRRIRRMTRKPIAPPIAISGASGPSTTPNPIEASAAHSTPGSSIGCVGAGFSPFAGICPPVPGRLDDRERGEQPRDREHRQRPPVGPGVEPERVGKVVVDPGLELVGELEETEGRRRGDDADDRGQEEDREEAALAHRRRRVGRVALGRVRRLACRARGLVHGQPYCGRRLPGPHVVAGARLPRLRARAMSAPDPETARYAVSTAIATGAICSVPIWVVRAREQDQRERGGDERPRERGEHRCEREPLRQPRDQHMGGGSGRAADEQHHEERSADEPGGLAQREHEDLREHDRDQQARAERRPVADHGRELIGSGEQRQRQRDADEPERDPPERRAKDRALGERSGEFRHDPDRDGCDQRERAGDEAEGNGREQLPVLVVVRRHRVDPDERRSRDREVHRERDRGRQQTCDQRVGEACRLWTRNLERENRRQEGR